MINKILAVFVGGFIGGIVRQLIDTLIQTTFPIMTLFINLSGTFLLTYCTNKLINFKKRYEVIFIGLTSGLLGAYTSFSGLILESDLLITKQNIFIVILYLIVSIMGGLVMIRLGRFLGEKYHD